MHLKLITVLYALILPTISQTITHSSPNPTYLIAPALVTVNNRTVIQCWRLNTPFKSSSTPGTSGAKTAIITNATNLAYTILPPRFNGGLHTAPVPQIVHFLSGLAHITLPDDPNTDLWLIGGVGGLLFATDTAGTGHLTQYPSDQETVGLIAPFEGRKVPDHQVLGEGGCEGLQTFM